MSKKSRSSENRWREPELPLTPRADPPAPGTTNATLRDQGDGDSTPSPSPVPSESPAPPARERRVGTPGLQGPVPIDEAPASPVTALPVTGPKQVKILVRAAPVGTGDPSTLRSIATEDGPVPAGDPAVGRKSLPQSNTEGSQTMSPPVAPAVPISESPTAPGESPVPLESQTIPARMMNEFVYCPRLFYYEFVEGVFVDSADTLRGGAIHQRVDSGSGALPAARKKVKPRNSDAKPAEPGDTVAPASTPAPAPAAEAGAKVVEPEIIHSRSVQMGSERLGIVAKMDLIEATNVTLDSLITTNVTLDSLITTNVTLDSIISNSVTPDPLIITNLTLDPLITNPNLTLDPLIAKTNAPPDAVASHAENDLFATLEVCPVDYKAGAPKEGADANELWDTDKMQLGLQALILRDNGYKCNEGVIYYRATKQRVRLPITSELEQWILQNIADARRVIAAPMPEPLIHSPKCVRCSLAPVCLPDETRMLAQPAVDETDGQNARATTAKEAPRRLIAARDDTRPLYLNTPGYRVGCKDEVLQIKDKDSVVEEVRMRDVSHVGLFGNVQISTQAIQSLCEQEVPVTYFSMGGWFYGITRGHALKNVFLRMEQFRLAREENTCLSLARQFVHGKIRNHRTLLMRNHLEPPEAIIGKLKRASEDALVATSIEELLGIEGAAASQYFQQFSGMVKVEDDLPGLEMPVPDAKQRAFNFNFNHRNRRPPTDPVNAMLSLAYSLLAKDCTLAALAVGFDPYLGFYHQPRFGRPALGLDLMEEFRPLIAESTVLSCINNRVITEKDFVRAGQAVNLSAPGRKRFFQTYEQRMSSLITHPLFDYKVSYRRALELQARLLAKTLTGEIAAYIPLMTR